MYTGPTPANGTRIVYRPGWGTDAPVEATVTGCGTKNGKPLVDLDNGHWAYTYQIESVVSEGERAPKLAPLLAGNPELSSRARQVGEQLARRLFAARGNHGEAHVSEFELALAIAAGAEVALKLRNITPITSMPTPISKAETG